MKPVTDSRAISKPLLSWYDRHARRLPWRTAPRERLRGVRPNPYHVWLSEVMLQQTRVATVREYFLKFIEKWPTIVELAKAESDDVMKAWAGLGYYSRARNLKKCAETVVREFGGELPRTMAELRSLPGIGGYTAAAIAAIAHDEAVAAVDGNVERVVSRLQAIDTPLPKAKPFIAEIAGGLVPTERPGDFAQAMMDLGATICTPTRPACALCPVRTQCAAGKAGTVESYPVKQPKAQIPTRRGAAFVACRSDGAVYLRKRAAGGLLGGMSEVPTTGWTARTDGALGSENAPFAADWRKTGAIRHTFTHFHLDLEIWHAEGVDNGVADRAGVDQGWWVPTHRLADEALPTVMRKAISAAIPAAFKQDA